MGLERQSLGRIGNTLSKDAYEWILRLSYHEVVHWFVAVQVYPETHVVGPVLMQVSNNTAGVQ